MSIFDIRALFMRWVKMCAVGTTAWLCLWPINNGYAQEGPVNWREQVVELREELEQLEKRKGQLSQRIQSGERRLTAIQRGVSGQQRNNAQMQSLMNDSVDQWSALAFFVANASHALDEAEQQDLDKLLSQLSQDEMQSTLSEVWATIWPALQNRYSIRMRKVVAIGSEMGDISEVDALTVGRWGNTTAFDLLQWSDELQMFEGGGRLSMHDNGRLGLMLADVEPGDVVMAPVLVNAERWEQGINAGVGLGRNFRLGGSIGYLIIALGVLAVVVGVIRMIGLARTAFRLRRQLQSATLHHDNPLGKVMHECANYRGVERAGLEARVARVVLLSSNRLRRGETVLKVTGGVAPLLGLIGTVVGMIATFNGLDGALGVGLTSELSEGIGTALVTTQLGMMVAIPALILFGVTSGWADSLIMQLKAHCAVAIGDWIQEHEWEGESEQDSAA